MVAPLRRVIVKRPEEAFRSDTGIGAEWQKLGFLRPPDFARACTEHARLVRLLEASGAEILSLPEDATTTLDSLYTHDPALMTRRGAVLLQMGKAARRGETAAMARALAEWGVPVLGSVDGNGTAEAGDMLWLDEQTLLVGRGFRTNPAGIDQLTAILSPLGVDVVPFHLPYREGPDEVLHLMSFISLLDQDLAVVYRPLLPVPLFELLAERQITLVDVPESEYATQGPNVLALAPRRVVMLAGNPATRLRLLRAGCQVHELDGTEICVPGAGGPTCLTRPLLRG